MEDWLAGIVDEVSATGLLWGVGLFVFSLVLSAAVVGALLVKLPRDFFLEGHDQRLWAEKGPVLRWTGAIGKNVLGVLLIAAGVLLSLPGIPGQGLLTVLIGVALLDIPGKRRLERRMLCRPRINRAVNRLRAKFGKPPLRLHEPTSPHEQCGTGANEEEEKAAKESIERRTS